MTDAPPPPDAPVSATFAVSFDIASSSGLLNRFCYTFVGTLTSVDASTDGTPAALANICPPRKAVPRTPAAATPPTTYAVFYREDIMLLDAFAVLPPGTASFLMSLRVITLVPGVAVN